MKFVALQKFLYTFQRRDHSFSTYAKFPEKLTFLTHGYAHVRVLIRGVKVEVFRKVLRRY